MMSDESRNPLESILSTASELESEGLRDAAIRLLSDFLSDPANTDDLSQTNLIKASTKLTRLKQERDRAKTLREEALHFEKGADYSGAEQKWRELHTILPNDQEVKDRLETLPERKKHSESIRLKLSVQDALERDQGVLAAKFLEEYRSLLPADLWAIEMLPKVQEAKEKEERLELQRQLKDAMSRNRHRLAIQVGEAMEKRGWLESHDLELYRHAHSKIAELTTLKQRGAELYTLGDLKSALRCYDEAQMIESDDPTLSDEGVRIRKVLSLMDSLRIALKDTNNERVERIVHELALLRHNSEDVQEIIREHRKRGKKRRLILAYAAAVIAVIAGGIYLSDTERKPAQSSTARSSQSDLPSQLPPAPLPATSSPSSSYRSEVPTELRWETKAPMPTPRVGASIGVIGNRIHVIGGKASSNAIVGTNELYDPQTDTWRTKASMPTPRSSPGIAVHNGLIYVFGGMTESVGLTDAVEVYDPATDSWTIAPPIQTTLRHFTAVQQIGSKVYVVGGVTASGNAPAQKGLGLLEVFDLSTNTWQRKADMPTPRRTPGIGLVDGRLFVIGGAASAHLDVVEEYDPTMDRWSQQPPMPTPRDRLRVASLQNLLVAIGGSVGAGRTSIVEIYEPSSCTWKSGPPMPTARESIAVAVVGETIFAIGGRHDQDGIIATNEMLDCRPLFANVQNDVQASDANQATTIFNGKDLAPFDTQGESNVWSVQDGIILGNNSGVKDGYLFSKEAYRDFAMTVDFKVTGNTNSGVFFHAKMENGKIRGIQAEVQPPIEGKSGGTGCLYETGGRGWLINPDTLTQTQQKAFRINDWNTLQVEVRNHHIKTKLNGVQIIDFTNHNPKWDSGLIALQMAGNKDGSILWRSLEVRPIPRGAAPNE